MDDSTRKLVHGLSVWVGGCQAPETTFFSLGLGALKTRINASSWQRAWKPRSQSACPAGEHLPPLPEETLQRKKAAITCAWGKRKCPSPHHLVFPPGCAPQPDQVCLALATLQHEGGPQPVIWDWSLARSDVQQDVCAGCAKHELPTSGVFSRACLHRQGVCRAPEVEHGRKAHVVQVQMAWG